MSLLNDIPEQDRACEILAAYIAEWGMDKVMISLPKDWEDSQQHRPWSGMTVNYITKDELIFSVKGASATKRWKV